MPPEPSATADSPSSPDASEHGGERMGRHVSAVSALTLSSRLFGLARDWCFTVFFSRVGWVTDAFFAALAIPNMFRALLGEGALASSYLPVFVDEREKGGNVPAARLAGQVLGLLAAVAGALAAVGMAVLWAIDAFVPTAPTVSLTLRLAATLFPYMPLICAAALLSSMLQALHRFAFAAGLSILFNLAFLAGFAWIYWGWCGGDPARLLDGPDGAGGAGGGPIGAAYLLAIAVLVSGVAQAGLAWARLASLGVRVTPVFRRDHPGVARVLKAFVPAALGAGVVQVNALIDMAIALWLSVEAPGAKTCLYYGNQLMHLPLALFATAVASTAFPFFARHAARGDHAALLARLGGALRMMFLVCAPAAVGLAVMADPIVRLLYQRPDLAFDHVTVYRTAQATTYYALGIPFFGAQMLLVRWLYARGDYRGPVRVAVAMVGLNLVLNLVLIHAPDALRLWTPAFSSTSFIQPADVPLWRGGYADAFGLADADFPFGRRLGEAGLALATTVTALVQVICLGVLVRRRHLEKAGKTGAAEWRREAGRLGSSAWRVAVAALGMGVLAQWFCNSIPYEPELPAQLGKALIPAGLGALAYFALGVIVPVPDIEAAARRLFRRPGPKRDGSGAERD